MRDPRNWSPFYRATLEKPLHPIFSQLKPHLPLGGLAVELGCGVGHGVEFLLNHGFAVLAVDAEPEAIEIAQSRISGNVTWETARFEALPFTCADLVVAGFSLFFLSPPAFVDFWARFMAPQPRSCVFAGQLLGVNDDWADRGYTVHTADEVRKIFSDWDVLHWEEAERDGETSVGEPKHWHVFHVVARKR